MTETEAIEIMQRHNNSEGIIALKELLSIWRERYRDKLEKENDEQVRGKAKNCKEILQIFVDL